MNKTKEMKYAKCLLNSTERRSLFVINENIYSDLAHGATTQHVDRVHIQVNWTD